MCRDRSESEPSAGVLLVVQEPGEDEEPIRMSIIIANILLYNGSYEHPVTNVFSFSSPVVCIHDREYGNRLWDELKSKVEGTHQHLVCSFILMFLYQAKILRRGSEPFQQDKPSVYITSLSLIN